MLFGIAAESSTPAPLHFDLDPHMHRLTDQRIQICTLARNQPVTWDRLVFHLLERCMAKRLM